MNAQLSMRGLTKTAIYTHINECEGVRHINNFMFIDVYF